MGEVPAPRDLIERLRVVLDERETDAMAMVEWLVDGGNPGIDFDAVPLVRRWWYTYTPADVRRTIQAHREILDLYEREQISATVCARHLAAFAITRVAAYWLCVEALASIYFPEESQ